jgi:signal transduction histidine kinase
VKLATRLTAFFLALSIVPLAVVGYLAFDSGRRSIEQDTFNRLISTTILKEAEFERWVEGNERSLHTLAREPGLREDAAALVSLDPADPAYQVARGRLLERRFGPTLAEQGGYDELYLLRASDGLILVSTDEAQEGKYRESEPYFLEGRSRTYTDDVTYSPPHGGPVMHVSTPVSDADGEVVAVLVGRTNLAEMSGIMLQRSGLSASEKTYLVNTFNFFVTEPRAGAGLALKSAVYTEGVTDCLAHNNGTSLYEDYRGEPVIGAYRWMPEHDLCILTEVDQAEAFASVAALRNTVLAIGAGVALIAILAGAFFARTITLPLGQLVRGAEEIGQGNLDYRIAVHGTDEIAQLAGAFNEMAARRRQAEEEIHALNADLERRIAERTAELEAANKELEAFAYSISHDLRAPLRAMDGFSRILIEEYAEGLPPDAAHYLQRVRGNAKQMGELIDDLLTFSRLSRQPLKAQCVKPAELVRRVLEDLGAAQEGREVQVTIGDLPACQADPALLRQVFTNLLDNALKFTRDQEVALIEVGCKRAGGNDVYYVKDNGAGFDMQYVDKLFGVFQRLHRAEEYEGTGVGLATVQRIIHRHRGRVWAEASVGQGATFYFTVGGGSDERTTRGDSAG